MSAKGNRPYKLSEMILRMLDRTITAEQFKYLENQLSNDPDAQDYYARIMKVCSSLQYHTPSYEKQPAAKVENAMVDQELWAALAWNERTAAGIEVEEEASRPGQESEQVSGRLRPTPGENRPAPKLAFYAAISSTAALLMILAYVMLNPRVSPVVATLNNTIDAKWEMSGTVPDKGDDLRCEKLTLLEGFAEIDFDDGAVVIMESPTEVVLEGTSRMYLASGKLSVSVPAHAKGFVIRTPNACVVDYGTEFTVVVGKSGDTEAHVFKGQIDLRTGSDPVLFDKSKRLVVGETAAVDADGRLTVRETCSYGFIRSIEQVQAARGLQVLGRNLIVNGDFEQNIVPFNPEFTDHQNMNNNVKIIGWNDETGATIIPYLAIGGPDLPLPERTRIPYPPDKGRNFYTGVQECTIWQEIDVSAAGYSIDNSAVVYELSGWFGGWKEHPDNAELVVAFIDSHGREISCARIGGITNVERRNRTCFTRQMVKGPVPGGTVKLRVDLISHRGIRLADSYADNLKLILYEK